jgi:hypothetical protein
MMTQSEIDTLVLQLSRGRELLIKEKYLRRYKRYRAKDMFYGVYNDEDADEPHEIWVEKAAPQIEKVITQIHEIMHFVHDVGDELEDPTDYDILARYIYQLCTQDYANRGEGK